MNAPEAARNEAGSPHIMIVAGEPSGDALGAQLMTALRKLTGGAVEITGVGGELMREEGLTSLFDISDTSVMGLREVVPKIPVILRRVRETADAAVRTRPDALVLIDSPDFTHRIARRLSRLAPEIKVIKYVAPQVWGSRPWRAAKLAEMVDHLLALLPFEPAFFEAYGLDTHFVGHPVTERVEKIGGGAAFRARHDIPPEAGLLCVLPGSRANEVRFLVPEFRETIRLVSKSVPDLVTVTPVVPHVRESLETAFAGWPVRAVAVGQDEKFQCFDAADAALAASGTVTTEVALARVPLVCAYRVGWLTSAIARHFITTKFVTLINLIRHEGVVPEFVQEACLAPEMAEELCLLLTDRKAAARQVAEQDAALAELGLGEEPPSLRAARAVLGVIGTPNSPAKLARRETVSEFP
ncbi:MAG: lipid-A-disaccharide synthase [Alphaproteobacteria bacterium]